MRKTVLFILITGLICIILGCTQSTTADNPPPNKVLLVEKSPNSAPVERGIDAEHPTDVFPVPDENGIFLEWYSSDETDLIAYDIYRRAENLNGNFTRVGQVFQRFGDIDTSYLDMTAGVDTIYYYYVVARDEDNQESDSSDIEQYKLLHKPESLNAPIGNSLFGGVFDWKFSDNFIAQYFIFRLEKIDSNNDYQPHFLALLDTEGRTQADQVWTQAELGITSLTPGNYRWRIDVRRFDERLNREGAESEWGEFRVE